MPQQDDSKMDKLTDKAQESLSKFFDDPEKVEKAQDKAESLLAKHMDKKSADEVVDKLTDVLRGFSHGGDDEPSR
jgi:hypothetical protein